MTPILLAEITEFTNSLLELGWSFSFSGDCLGDLSSTLRNSLRVIACKLDSKCSHECFDALHLATESYGFGPNWDGEIPTVVLDISGIVVVQKPPHWEVDARVGGAPTPEMDAYSPLLSAFLRRKYSREAYPLIHCSEQQFGIIHRLDTPSSGLILVGKNFEGYYTLRWQLDTYEMGREYLVLCHGRLPWGRRVINAKIKTSKEAPASSKVSDEGKPAWTQVVPLCLVELGEWNYSLVAVVIRTGRTHQIRVHLKHIGHPTVTDGKYTDELTYKQDKKWCPRNFLHRCRLTFDDTDGTFREACCPLPSDLCDVLRKLSPVRDGRSAVAFEKIQSGWVPNAHAL